MSSYPLLPILPSFLPSFFLPSFFSSFLPSFYTYFPYCHYFSSFNASPVRRFLHHASQRENAAEEICDSISKYIELNSDDKDKEKEKEKEKEREADSASPMPGDNSTRNGNGNGSSSSSSSSGSNGQNGGSGGKQEQSQETKNMDKERDRDKGKDEKRGGIKAVNGMESGRLIKLLQQAFAYQITQSMTSSLCTFEKQEVSVFVPVRTTTTGAIAVAGGGGVIGGVGGGGGGVMVRSIEDDDRGRGIGGERGSGGKERAMTGGDMIERGETVTAGAAIKSPAAVTPVTTLTTMTTAAAAAAVVVVVVPGVDSLIAVASGGLEKEEEDMDGTDGTVHAATTSSSTSTLALSSSSSSSSALPVIDSTRLPLPITEHSSLPPPTLPLSLPLPLPLSDILPQHMPSTMNRNINTQGLSEGRGGWIDPVPRVHRLIEDFKPTVLPGTLMAILTMNPVSSIPYINTQPSSNTNTEAQNAQYRDNYTVPQRNLGDIRCFSMLPASSTGAGSGLFQSYLAGNRDSRSEFQSQLNKRRNNRLTVVAGTDRGSLILWQVPSSLPPLHTEYEVSSGVFDISHPSFSQRLLPPSAILHLRKGDNVRVRRTYRSDDDDSTDLFPPKIRDVAVSSSTGSLGWFHSDSPSDSFLLVAAALSDGTIALVCAGDAVGDSDEGGLRNGRRGRERGRERDRDRDDSVNRRGISSNRARSQSRFNCFESDRRDDREREYNDYSKPAYSFSQKRCYLETHEVKYTVLPYHLFLS